MQSRDPVDEVDDDDGDGDDDSDDDGNDYDNDDDTCRSVQGEVAASTPRMETKAAWGIILMTVATGMKMFTKRWRPLLAGGKHYHGHSCDGHESYGQMVINGNFGHILQEKSQFLL